MTLQKGILAFLFVGISYIIKGLAGFGDPLISNPLLSMQFATSTITPGLGIVSPVLNAELVIKNRKHFNAKLVLPIAGFNVLGIIPGVLLLERFGANEWIKLVLGAVIIYLGIRMLLNGRERPEKPNLPVCFAVSFASGVTAGLFGINMLYLPYMERIAENREQFRANTCFVFIIADLIRLGMYVAKGLVTKDVLILATIALPAALAGMWAGSVIDRRVNDSAAKRLIRYVFILGGISTVIYACIAIWG